MRYPLRAAIAATLLAAACSPAPSEISALVVNAHQAGTLTVGNERVLVALLDGTDPYGGPDDAIEIEVFFGDRPDSDAQLSAADFIWTVPESRGIYRAHVDFDRPGTWSLIAHLPDGSTSDPVRFSVQPDSPIPAAGDPAVAVATPTGGVRSLDEITTDPAPDPAFYRLSLDEAVGNGRPTVVVFATPAFCTSATCGPVLDVVKEVARSFPNVDFVHVEVYENLSDANALTIAPAVVAWSLPSEPWVYVVDSKGHIAADFEGTVSIEELRLLLGSL